MKKIIVLFLIAFIFVSCSDDEKTIEKISSNLVSDISLDKEDIIQSSWNQRTLTNDALTNDMLIIIEQKSEWEKLLNSNTKAPDLMWLTNWINGEEITSLEELKGKVVFIDFWTYTCINCIRTLDHMQELHEKYGEDWLVIIWVHAPEFAYERKIENVKSAVEKYGLTYRVALDNNFATWKNYKNRYWPAQYIINKQWVLRYVHFREWKYEEMEEVVEFLLSE